MLPQLTLLSNQMRWFLLIHICKHGIQLGFRASLGRFHRTKNRRAFLISNRCHSIIIHPSIMTQEFVHAQYWIGNILCSLNFIHITISRGIIRGTMMTLSIRHCFDHDWHGRFYCQFTCCGHSRMDSKDIIPIHTYASHSISRSTADYSISSILIFGWSRNGITIISTKEDHGSSQCGSKVACRVEVSGRSCSFTKVDNRYCRLLLLLVVHRIQLELVSSSHCLGDLSPKR
mmetsp:Transcript_28262/g.44497  ORF Transcript_28262/g.44497 Transcript_28262/m.44497 type:complete len:231 (-) Transcript_28262:1163-1855(-)